MRHEESQSQRKFIARVRLDARTKNLVIAAIPNGGKRGVREAALMKAEGVLRGMPDIFVAEPHKLAAGLFIEFKSATGTVKPHQRAMLDALEQRGYDVAVVRSADEAWNVLMRYLAVLEKWRA